MSIDRPRSAIIAAIGDEVSDRVKQIIENATRSCINCMHFDEASETCGITTPRQRPPARIIAAGCNLWLDDGTIPF